MQNFGVLLIDKPTGITSFDVVRKLRKIINIKKIGHTGTLDPFASGLLPVCIGKATRIVNYLSSQEKEYAVKIELGKKTDTGDIDGKLLVEKDVPDLSLEKIESVIPEILDLKEQVPPRFSAIKINGKRAYELARQNQDFERKSRSIKIFDFEILKTEFPHISYKTRVSKGTYIRALSESFAEKLGTIATTIELKRTKSGNLKIMDTVSLDEISAENWQDFLKPLSEIFSHFYQVMLNQSQISDFKNGRFVHFLNENRNDAMILDEKRDCLGFADLVNNNVKPKIVLI